MTGTWGGGPRDIDGFYVFFHGFECFFFNLMDFNGFVEWISVDLCNSWILMDFADLSF